MYLAALFHSGVKPIDAEVRRAASPICEFRLEASAPDN